MSEVFLVYLARPETAPEVLSAALKMAEHVGPVRFEVMTIRLPPEATILPTEEVLSEHEAARIRREEADRAKHLRAIYEKWAKSIAGTKHRAQWIDIEGLAGTEIPSRGRQADLIVLDRLHEPVTQIAKDALHAAVFECHRPVLVVPPSRGKTMGRHLTIAWKDDERAIKAVIPALRYFPAPDDIAVLIGLSGDETPKELPPPLAEREIDARIVPIAIGTDPPGQTLLEQAHKVGADVLVMGAYAHHPLREMMLGGVTRYMLQHADLPLLMRH
jgi:nucleotide-binding universal stress UspA family protein